MLSRNGSLRSSYGGCSLCSGPCAEVSDGQRKKLSLWQNKLKRELSTREHIPNKKEAKALRISRKKSGISRKKLCQK